MIPEADPVEEGRRLVAVAEAAGAPARLVGGVAVAIRAPSVADARPERTYHDIDLAAVRPTARELARTIEANGYTPHRRFNTLAGERLMFADEANGRRLDVFLDRIEMCHTLDFRDRLTRDPETLCLADLLLSKLQIVKLTERDVVDASALLSEHAPSADGGGIDLATIEAVCCSDWGWWRTVTGNLRVLADAWSATTSVGPDLRAAREHALELLDRLTSAPKTMRWKMRARVGERVSWFQEPEEVR